MTKTKYYSKRKNFSAYLLLTALVLSVSLIAYRVLTTTGAPTIGIIVLMNAVTAICTVSIQKALQKKNSITTSTDQKDSTTKIEESTKTNEYNKRYENFARIIQEYNHEIRTPLQAIITYAEYLPSNEHDMNFRNLIEAKEVILTNAERANNLVSTTLQLSIKNYVEEARGNKENIDLKELIRDCISIQSYPKNIVTRSKFRKDLCVHANKSAIEKVISNLLKNAKDAMPQGGEIRITVDETNEDACIEIQDTGVGIPKEQLDSIWLPHQSGHEGEGRGLGLSFVQDIIEENNGKITVNSEEGIGTTFKVFLKKTTK